METARLQQKFTCHEQWSRAYKICEKFMCRAIYDMTRQIRQSEEELRWYIHIIPG